MATQKYKTPEDEMAAQYRYADPEMYGAGISNEKILQFEKSLDPTAYASLYESTTLKQKVRLAKAEKEGADQWAASDPVANLIEKASIPGTWFNNNFLSPAVQSIDDSAALLAKGLDPKVTQVLKESIFGRIISGSKAADDLATEGTSALGEFAASGKGGAVGREAAKVASMGLNVAQAVNPVPKSVGEAVVGGAMMGASEFGLGTAGLAGRTLARATPEAVEGAFNKVANVIPNANKGFTEAASAKTALGELQAASERTANAIGETKAGINERIATKKDKLIRINANAVELLGDTNLTPQIQPEVMGRLVRDSLDPRNPKSNAALTAVPIAEQRVALDKKLDSVTVPLHTVSTGLEKASSRIKGLIMNPMETQAKMLLGKYLNQDEWVNTPDGDTFSSEAKSVTATQMRDDAASLQTLADTRFANGDKLAGQVLADASKALKEGLKTVLPEDVHTLMKNNNEAFAKWHDTYNNQHTNGIFQTGAETGQPGIPSKMVDPIFSTPEATRAYQNAVSPEEFHAVRKHKINETISKIMSSDNPLKAFNDIEAAKPGFLDTFMDKDQKYILRDIVENKNGIAILNEDLKGLQETLDKHESARIGEEGQAKIIKGRGGFMQDKSLKTQLPLMGGSGLGVLGVMMHYHPYVSATIAAVTAAGWAPELLGRLYLASPEMRSFILESGVADTHVARLVTAAKIGNFLDAKRDDIAKYRRKGESLPPSLQKFDDAMRTPAKDLPKVKDPFAFFKEESQFAPNKTKAEDTTSADKEGEALFNSQLEDQKRALGLLAPSTAEVIDEDTNAQ